MSDTSAPAITLDLTMEEILKRIPSAQRALFQRYHIGGCSSCAFQPTDTLEQVCKDHNILDPQEVVTYLMQAHEVDERIQVEPALIRGWLSSAEETLLLDVRPEPEREGAEVPGAEPLDYTNSSRYMELPKDRRIVFLCRNGQESLNVASYFIGHQFTNVWVVKGGAEAWHGAAGTPVQG
jgi:rhodanese-related sulfurtransferase